MVLLDFHVSQIMGGSSSSGGWGTFVNIFTGFANDDVGRQSTCFQKLGSDEGGFPSPEVVVGGHSSGDEKKEVSRCV